MVLKETNLNIVWKCEEHECTLQLSARDLKLTKKYIYSIFYYFI